MSVSLTLSQGAPGAPGAPGPGGSAGSHGDQGLPVSKKLDILLWMQKISIGIDHINHKRVK